MSTSDPTWLTVPDIVELLGVPQGKVRRLIEDRVILAVRVDGILKVPADFFKNGEPLHELRGTLLLLADEDSLGTTPLEALRHGRKAEVRRVAQALAF